MSIAAGWYADPVGPGAVRWWDGTAWTGTTASLPPASALAVAAPPVPPYVPAPSHVQAPYVQAPHRAVADDPEWSALNLLIPRARTLGVRALVWGIVAAVLPIALAPAAMALVFGAMGLDRANRLRAAGVDAQGRGMSIAGIVLGGVSLVSVIALVVVASLARG